MSYTECHRVDTELHGEDLFLRCFCAFSVLLCETIPNMITTRKKVKGMSPSPFFINPF